MRSFLEFQMQNGMNTFILALGALLFSTIVRNPFLMKLVWFVVLLKFLTPPLIGIAVPIAMPSIPKTSNQLVPLNRSLSANQPSDLPVSAPPEFDSSEIPSENGRSSQVTAPIFDRREWIDWGLFTIWSIGALIFLHRVVRSTRQFRRLLAESAPPDRALSQEVNELACSMGLRRCPPIRLVSASISPMVWGLGSSLVILLPRDLLRNLSAVQRQALLVHELVHVQQKDHWVRLLEVVMLTLFWWNPIAWWARREHHLFEEQCCDARVVHRFPERRREYGIALLAATDFISERVAFPTATSFAKMNVHRRIESILKGTHRPSRFGMKLGSIVMAIAILPWSFSLSQEKSVEKEPLPTGEAKGAAVVDPPRLPSAKQTERPEWKELNELYKELRDQNRELTQQLLQIAEDKEFKLAGAVHESHLKDYTPKHVRLMDLAKQFPDTDVAFDAAMLTLTTTFYESRDTAVDILSQQIDSSKLAPAFAAMRYTFRLKDFCDQAIKSSPHRAVIAHARFHLAEHITRDGREDIAHAKQILRDTMIEYPDVVHVPGGWGVIPPDGTIRDVSMKLLARLNANEKVQIGELLESISGVDIEGEPLSTEDYRGKTTLVVFWATWCSPCMELVALEKKLIDRYRGQPFEIVGVCGDLEFDDDFKASVKRHGIPYRSFQNELPGGSRISDRLGVPRWPYVILLDGEGIVREHRFADGVVVDKAWQERSFQSIIEQWLPNFKPKETPEF